MFFDVWCSSMVTHYSWSLGSSTHRAETHYTESRATGPLSLVSGAGLRIGHWHFTEFWVKISEIEREGNTICPQRSLQFFQKFHFLPKIATLYCFWKQALGCTDCGCTDVKSSQKRITEFALSFRLKSKQGKSGDPGCTPISMQMRFRGKARPRLSGYTEALCRKYRDLQRRGRNYHFPLLYDLNSGDNEFGLSGPTGVVPYRPVTPLMMDTKTHGERTRSTEFPSSLEQLPSRWSEWIGRVFSWGFRRI